MKLDFELAVLLLDRSAVSSPVKSSCVFDASLRGRGLHVEMSNLRPVETFRPKSQWQRYRVAKVSKVHPLGTMNVFSKC